MNNIQVQIFNPKLIRWLNLFLETEKCLLTSNKFWIYLSNINLTFSFLHQNLALLAFFSTLKYFTARFLFSLHLTYIYLIGMSSVIHQLLESLSAPVWHTKSVNDCTTSSTHYISNSAHTLKHKQTYTLARPIKIF